MYVLEVCGVCVNPNGNLVLIFHKLKKLKKVYVKIVENTSDYKISREMYIFVYKLTCARTLLNKKIILGVRGSITD